MSSYTTPDQVKDILRLRNAVVPDSVRIPVDDLNVTVIDTQITDAAGTVDLYCSGKTVPAAFLTSATNAIAAWSLVLTYLGSVDLQDQDPVIRRYNSAMSSLEDVGTGRINPVSDPPSTGDGDEFGAGGIFNPLSPHLTGVDWFGRPRIVDEPWGYPGAW